MIEEAYEAVDGIRILDETGNAGQPAVRSWGMC